VTTRALGWKKQAEDSRDHDAMKVMLRTVPSVPAAADNHDLVKIVNQGQLGSCTANGSGQAVRAAQILEIVEKQLAAWTAAGKPASLFDSAAATKTANDVLEFWSRLMSYYLARSFEGTVKEDAGANIRDIFRAINKFGFCAESVWPYNDNSDPEQGPTPFNHMPSAEAFRAAFDQRASAQNVQANVIDYALIRETGDARVDAIKLAISQRHLVVFGTDVTEKFCSDMSANNGQPIEPPTDGKDIAGGHCMAIGGYDELSPKIINSWDTDWGQNGWCRFSWDYIKWSNTSDLWIVRRAPLLVAA
jgi:C1A family cysteine protease